MIVKMIKELRRRRDKQREKFEVLTKRQYYKEQPEIKNTIAEMETALEGSCNRLNDTQDESAIRKGVVEITEDEQKKKNKEKRGEFKRPLEQHQA